LEDLQTINSVLFQFISSIGYIAVLI